MKKIKLSCILSLMILCFLVPGLSAHAQEIEITAQSSVLIDASTGEILFENNKDEKLPPASITKVMTMLLTMEAINEGKITLEDQVTISEHASQMGGTQLYLEPGELRTVEELLMGVSVESANDASVALGEHIGGTHEAFIKLMNDRAKELGMENSQFRNTNGLPEEGHYSTAYDIALMSRELVKYPKIHQYLTIWMTDVTVGKNNDQVRTLANTNKLLRTYDGLDGIKTGYTSEAKHCLSATAKKGNMRLISVVLGGEDSKIRFNETAKLLDYGFANYEGISVANENEEIQEVRVEKGKQETVQVITEEPLTVLIQKGADGNIDKKIILESSIKAPIEKGEKIGELIAYSGKKELGKVNLISQDSIDEANIIFIYRKLLKNWISPVKE